MYERFTEESRKVLQLANQEAVRRQHEQITPEHIVLALLKTGSLASSTLAGIDPRQLTIDIAKTLPPADPSATSWSKRPFNRAAKYVIEHAMREAGEMDSHVQPSHLLLGVLHTLDSPAAETLRNSGLTLETARQAVELGGAIPFKAEILAAETPFAADEHIRRAITVCWSKLPVQRRTAEELESQVRRLVDRALRDFREELEQFGTGGGESG